MHVIRKCAGLAGFLLIAGASGFGATAAASPRLSATPPMGWNDWAHYQCGFTADTILANAKALVSTGLAADGYDTVTIDDCWMQKERDNKGDLQVDPGRFPNGMKPVADEIHKLGLKFGIYEDAGYETCGKFAGSGEVKGGGRNYFEQDARLFASWGVDYLKLDGCNLYVPPGSTKEAVYRKAYRQEHDALRKVGRPVVFSESAPAYFQGTPTWYSVLNWIGDYGQLWREGTDVEIRRVSQPDRPRFNSVLWNYSYNLPLGRFQHPGNWNDADFIIGGDTGMTPAETRSQMALWSMMSAPLILSSNLSKLSKESLAVLGNKRIIAIDQDRLGKMATLVSRSQTTDVLWKPLTSGGAVAVLNHGDSPIQVTVSPSQLGFKPGTGCRLQAENLWDGSTQPAVASLMASIAPHDTAIWRVHPSSACGRPARVGAITMENNTEMNYHQPYQWAQYTRCLTSSGNLETCTGAAAERWKVTGRGTIESGGQCLSVNGGKPAVGHCKEGPAAQWHYTRLGELVNQGDHQCLTAGSGSGAPLAMQPCGSAVAAQIWSLPNSN